MTRINTIDVKHLTDQHLMAEYRELPMVNAALNRSLSSKSGVRHSSIPKNYTLNRGHVMFFYNKGEWLYERYQQLIGELRERGYDIDPDSRVVKWDHFVYNGLYNSWEPDEAAHKINVERLVERVSAKVDWYRKSGVPIDDRYLTFLKQTYGV